MLLHRFPLVQTTMAEQLQVFTDKGGMILLFEHSLKDDLLPAVPDWTDVRLLKKIFESAGGEIIIGKIYG